MHEVHALGGPADRPSTLCCEGLFVLREHWSDHAHEMLCLHFGRYMDLVAVARLSIRLLHSLVQGWLLHGVQTTAQGV